MVSHPARGAYLRSFSSLAASKDDGDVLIGMVTFTITAVEDSPLRTTRSGLRSPGESLVFCSANLLPADVGVALMSLFRILLCRSLIRPAFGGQEFKMWARVSGALLHFGHVSSAMA